MSLEPLVLQFEGVLSPATFVADVVRPFARIRGGPAPEGVDPADHELNIWREALQTGAFTLNAPRDVWRNLKRWKAAGRPLIAISDVSARHVSLLLGFTPHGDAGAFFARVLGPEAGAPDDPATWRALAPAGVVVSDRPSTLDAAQAAGWTALRFKRNDGATLDTVAP